MPRLENWFIKRGLSEKTLRLYGEIYNDKRFEDGASITTTLLQEIGEGYARTKSTMYELGKESNLNKIERDKNIKYYFIKKGGEAIHKLGNISRYVYDAELIIVHDEDDEYLIGNYDEGFGLVNVKFKKSDCRLATDDELFMCDCGKMEEIRY